VDILKGPAADGILRPLSFKTLVVFVAQFKSDHKCSDRNQAFLRFSLHACRVHHVWVPSCPQSTSLLVVKPCIAYVLRDFLHKHHNSRSSNNFFRTHSPEWILFSKYYEQAFFVSYASVDVSACGLFFLACRHFFARRPCSSSDYVDHVVPSGREEVDSTFLFQALLPFY